MTALFQYSIAVSIPLLIMWITYRWALASEKQFVLNRFVLLSIYTASIVAAFTMLIAAPAGERTSAAAITISFHDASYSCMHWLKPMSVIWLCGASLALLGTVAELFKIRSVMRRCKKAEKNGCVIYITDDCKQAPFSFGKSIVMNASDYEESADLIMAHEYGHISLLHSCDMIVAQAMAIFCWYNPAAWLMRSELKSVHEYQADLHALNRGINAREYQLLLIKKAAGSKFPSIGNNLNHSYLKRRIAMMQRSGETPAVRKLLYLLPVASLAIAISVLASPTVKAAITPLKQVSRTESNAAPGKLRDVTWIVDGEELPYDNINDIPASEIKSITVRKDKNQIYIDTKDTENE